MLALNGKARNVRQGRVGLILESAPELVYAFFRLEDDSVVFDASKLRELVERMVRGAKKVDVDLGDSEAVWIAKFSSVVSRVIIGKVLMEIEGVEAMEGFGRLYLPVFMGKIPLGSIHVALWSDAFEPIPVGDTWFS